jgi:hypothetical protein
MQEFQNRPANDEFLASKVSEFTGGFAMRIIATLFVSSLLTCAAFAGTESPALAAAKAKQVELHARVEKSEALRVTLEAELASYHKLADPYDAKIKVMNAEAAKWTADIARYNLDVDRHNAHQCVEQKGSNSCDWYTAEKQDLDTEKARLEAFKVDYEARKVVSDAELAKNEAIRVPLIARCDAFEAARLALNAEVEANNAEIARLEKK